jgi:hypothetical protein
MQANLSDREPHGLAGELAALQHLDSTVLKQRWRALYQTEAPARISRSLLLQAVAYRIQEQALGGLKSSTRRLLERAAHDDDIRPPTKPPPKTVIAGTVLIREWHGVSHAVTVLEDGALFHLTRYRSLSAVARQITGTRWSGPRFFGLRSIEETDHGAR